jgi:hypothetical protein
MSHRVEVVNEQETVAVNYYCSDYCAKNDADYSGWNGCNDVFAPVACPCGTRLGWYRWNYEIHDQEYVAPEALDYWVL